MNFFSKIFTRENKESLDQGLEKSKEGFLSRLNRAVVGKSTVDAEVLDHLEEVLISGDVGVQTTVKIIRRIEERVKRDKYINTAELNRILKQEVAALLEERDMALSTVKQFRNFSDPLPATPYVMMVVGVNGAGKTT